MNLWVVADFVCWSVGLLTRSRMTIDRWARYGAHFEVLEVERPSSSISSQSLISYFKLK